MPCRCGPTCVFWRMCKYWQRRISSKCGMPLTRSMPSSLNMVCFHVLWSGDVRFGFICGSLHFRLPPEQAACRDSRRCVCVCVCVCLRVRMCLGLWVCKVSKLWFTGICWSSVSWYAHSLCILHNTHTQEHTFSPFTPLFYAFFFSPFSSCKSSRRGGGPRTVFAQWNN